MNQTSIEWTDATWNPVTGCSKVSQGCKNCYAERYFPRPYPGRKFTDVRVHPNRLDWPLRWRGSPKAKSEGRPSRIFVNSMSDLFHAEVDISFIDKIFAYMVTSEQHVFQILTKRADRMEMYFNGASRMNLPLSLTAHARIARAAETLADIRGEDRSSPYWDMFLEPPYKNVWLGVSVEDQKTADERIPLLLQTPAAVRFISYEPALGPVDLRHIQYDNMVEIDALTGDHGVYRPLAGRSEAKLDWVIAGGESGPRARPAHPDWFRAVRDQCQSAGVPFFFKQWGEWAPKASLSGVDDWNGAGKHTLVMPGGEFTARRGPDRPDPEFGLAAADLDGNDGAAAMAFIGRREAGRLLDGREWNEFPK